MLYAKSQPGGPAGSKIHPSGNFRMLLKKAIVPDTLSCDLAIHVGTIDEIKAVTGGTNRGTGSARQAFISFPGPQAVVS